MGEKPRRGEVNPTLRRESIVFCKRGVSKNAKIKGFFDKQDYLLIRPKKPQKEVEGVLVLKVSVRTPPFLTC